MRKLLKDSDLPFLPRKVAAMAQATRSGLWAPRWRREGERLCILPCLAEQLGLPQEGSRGNKIPPDAEGFYTLEALGGTRLVFVLFSRWEKKPNGNRRFRVYACCPECNTRINAGHYTQHALVHLDYSRIVTDDELFRDIVKEA